MFIDSNDLIEIKIFYRKIKNSYVSLDEEKYEKLSEEHRAKYKCLIVKTKPLTWGMYNELNEESITKDNSGNRSWNSKLYKENKLRKILVSWDAQHDVGGKMVAVPITLDTIKSLAREIAETIILVYDSMMEISDEDEKK